MQRWRPSAGKTTEEGSGSTGRAPGFSERKKNSLKLSNSSGRRANSPASSAYCSMKGAIFRQDPGRSMRHPYQRENQARFTIAASASFPPTVPYVQRRYLSPYTFSMQSFS